MSMTINELVNHIAAELPDGVGLCICIEGGANWVELEDRTGHTLDFFPDAHRDLEATVLDALSHAQAEAKA